MGPVLAHLSQRRSVDLTSDSRALRTIPKRAALLSTAASDPGCVKTLHGIIAPGILGSVVMRRAKKRKNLSSARHYDQIRFGFHTTKTQQRHAFKRRRTRAET